MIFSEYFDAGQPHAIGLEPVALVSVAGAGDLGITDTRVATLLVGHELTATDTLLAGGMVDVIL